MSIHHLRQRSCATHPAATTTTTAGAAAAAHANSSSSLAVKCRLWRQRLVICTVRRQQHHVGNSSSSGKPSADSSLSAAAHPAVASALPANADSTSTLTATGSNSNGSSSSSCSMPLIGATLEVTCDRLGVGGVGVCLWGASKLVLMVKGALPGEVLVTKITAVKKGYAEGVKVATLQPHQNATTPYCQHFGTCGGCSLQSMQYEAQLQHKTEHVAQLFTRVGRLNPSLVQATRLNPAAAAETRRYQYRNKIQLAFSTRVWQGEDQQELSTGNQQQQLLPPPPLQQQQEGRVVDGWGLGFYLPGSNSVVMPVEQCSLVPAEFNAVIATVRNLCQQQQLQPYDPLTGSGVLRHLIIRCAAAAADHGGTAAAAATDIAIAAVSGGSDPSAAMAAAAALTGQQAATPAVAAAAEANLMVVFVTTDTGQPSLLQPLCKPLMEVCPNVASVVHSTEAAAAAAVSSTYDPLGLDLPDHLVGNLGPAAKAAVVAVQQRSGVGRKQRKSSKTSSRQTQQQQWQQQQQRRGARALTVSSTTVLAGEPYLVEKLCGLHFHISPHSFFQTNTQQAELLYEQVVMAVQDYYTPAQAVQVDDGSSTAAADAAAAATAGIHGHQQGGGSSIRSAPRQQSGVVLDLYCGTGTITLALASRLQQHCKQIIGFDVSESSITDARANALRNGIKHAKFVCGDLTQLACGDLIIEPWNNSKPDVVVVDPARAGLSKSVIDYLLRCGADRVVYVSCNPATQARDLQLLCCSGSSSGTTDKQQQGRTAYSSSCSLHSGAFEVVSWRGVDMFPQTDHLETVVVLDRV